MGLAVDREDFKAEEYQAFSKRLHESLTALDYISQQDDFDQAPLKIGAELENYLVDDQGAVLPLNTQLIEAIGDPNFTVELNRFNLEINFDPVYLQQTAFSELQYNMETALRTGARHADKMNAKIVPIGILPTLRHEHFNPKFITDSARYRALSKHLRSMRGEDFLIHIRGEDEIKLTSDHVALEGANASFQYHLMVPPGEFADVFNDTQLVSSVLIAITANSAVLFDKLLWDETRIALFKQSIDSRARNRFDWQQPSRVTFGHGWVREGAWELFAETVALYPPIFPILSDEAPLDAIEQGITPQLDELCLHMGTTWPWNRPVYDGSDGGHIRIEMRALPAGPTVVDMVANAAFATGLVMGLKGSIRDLMAVMPFQFAEYNFYRTAQQGLDANIIWPHNRKHQLVESPVVEILRALVPVAEHGLKLMGIGNDDIQFYLGIILRRIETRSSGARWQKSQIREFEQRGNRREACQRMFQDYMRQQAEEKPVSEWSIRKHDT